MEDLISLFVHEMTTYENISYIRKRKVHCKTNPIEDEPSQKIITITSFYKTFPHMLPISLEGSTGLRSEVTIT